MRKPLRICVDPSHHVDATLASISIFELSLIEDLPDRRRPLAVAQ